MNCCRDDFYPKALDTVRQYFKPEEAKVIVDVTGREYYVSVWLFPSCHNMIKLK